MSFYLSQKLYMMVLYKGRIYFNLHVGMPLRITVGPYLLVDVVENSLERALIGSYY